MFDLGIFNLPAAGALLLQSGEASVDIGISNIYLQGTILIVAVLVVAFFSSASCVSSTICFTPAPIYALNCQAVITRSKRNSLPVAFVVVQSR